MQQEGRGANPTEEEDDAFNRGGEHTARDEEERLISSDDQHEHETEHQQQQQQQQQPKFSLHPAWRFVIVMVSFGIAMIFIKIVVVLVLQYQQQADQASQQEPDYTSKYDPIWHNGSDTFGPTVVLVSLDGFRAEYLQRDLTPNMLEFARTGVRAEYMHPAFPTLTFPNHWTLVTGLHPESHGIVANDFYDPAMKKEFTFRDAENPSWFNGEPIWKTIKSEGKISAVTMWPGSTAKGLQPDYVVPYNESVTAKEKMDTVLQWLDMPNERRPNFIGAYIGQTDQQGHASGTNDDKTNRVIKEMDDAIGYLVGGLQTRNLFNSIHVIIVSDHGMTNTDNSRIIYYDDILSNSSMHWLRGREASPLLNLRFKDDTPQDIITQAYNELLSYTQQTANPPFQVFLKQDVPHRFHYSNNDRITPIVVIPNVGYVLVSHEEWHPSSPKQRFAPKGIHGYDNMAAEMRAIFLAHGPRIDRYYGRHTILAPFHNTEVYSFMCQLLNVKPASHNGTLHGQFMRVHR